MRIIEIGTLNVKKGGPPYSLCKQMLGLRENGVESVCFMQPCEAEDIIDNDLNIVFSKKVKYSFMGFDYIPYIDSDLSSLSNYDVMHIQTIWTYMSHKAARYAYTHDIPYVLAPRGSLYAKALKGSKWLKKMAAWYVYERRDMERAACVQATCVEEMMEIRKMGCKSPIAVIPNAYSVPMVEAISRKDDHVFRVGYIGRLSPRKHVERLIYALSHLRDEISDMELKIIGSDDQKYEQFLKEECRRYGVSGKVTFTGFLKGQEKDDAICSCSVFVFPSDFENWGNVVPDVLSRGVPAVTTIGMPWKILEDYDCGWWISNSQKAIDATLRTANALGADKLSEMGMRGRELINERYSVKGVGKMQKELYSWLLYGGDKPDFVYQ